MQVRHRSLQQAADRPLFPHYFLPSFLEIFKNRPHKHRHLYFFLLFRIIFFFLF